MNEPTVLPADLSMERALIGACVKAPDLLPQVMALLDAADFTSPAYSKVFAAIVTEFEDGRPVDFELLRSKLERSGEILLLGGASELFNIVENETATGAHACHYAKSIAELATKRRIIAAAERTIKSAMNGALSSEILDSAKTDLDRISVAASTVFQRKFKSCEEVLATVQEKHRWFLEYILMPSSITLVVGKPKVGKSFIVYSALAALEEGRPFIDLEVEKASAVILSEEPAGTAAEKIRRFGLKDAYFYLRSDLYPGGSLSDHCTRAAAIALERGAKIIVFDTWSKWAGLTADQENNAGAVDQAMAPIIRLAGMGYSVVLIHHAKKGVAEEGEQSRGSSAILGSVETMVDVRRLTAEEDDSSMRSLTIISRWEGAPEEPLVVEFTGHGFQAHGSVRDMRTGKIENQIIKSLSESPWQDATSLSEGCDFGDKKKFSSACRKMAAPPDRRLVKDGDGRAGSPFIYAIAGSEAAAAGVGWKAPGRSRAVETLPGVSTEPSDPEGPGRGA